MSKAAIKKYLESIGAQGGKKSRRKLSKKDARAMADKRWKATQGAKPVGKKHARPHVSKRKNKP